MSVRRLIVPLALGCVFLLLPVVASAAGDTWTEAEIGLPNQANDLLGQVVHMSGISCPTTTTCTAIGDYQYNENQGTRPILLSEQGGTWQANAVNAPLPHNAGKNPEASLGAIDCSTAKSCTAVGSYGAGRWSPPLLLSESGGKWTADVTPKAPVGQWRFGVSSLSVSCASAAHCVAVGYGNVLLTQKGKTWKSLAIPQPKTAWSGAGPTLTSVACSAAGECVAVGRYADATGEASWQGLIETEHKGRWHAVEAPVPADAVASWSEGVYLNQVACPSTGNCVAIGQYTTKAGNSALILTETNGVWSAATAPVPSNAIRHGSFSLAKLACSSGLFCTAVGIYVDKKTLAHYLVDTDENGVWTADSPPLPSSLTLRAIESLSCRSVDTCAAVSVIDDPSATPNEEGLVLGWAGVGDTRQWEGLETELPSGTGGVMDLGAVDCPDLDHCSAVGSFNDGSVNQGLLLTESNVAALRPNGSLVRARPAWLRP